ncbi:hypothetical protein [Halosolutus gelatinilyticus]|uniref:hypothetical protein n=1 Tax=Halosolutus gelatinilyticus TaxID=2931975 RepID=UPI001FF48249|nr:hypothetical protein [Halosolutus gelatinilyticus]
MSPVTSATDRSVPTRVVFDRIAERLQVVVDAAPADVDDVAVAVGSTRVRVTIAGELPIEVTGTPPTPRHRFTDDRAAYYNNGVLTVSIGTTRRRW